MPLRTCLGLMFLLLSLASAQNGSFIVAYEDSSDDYQLQYANFLQEEQFLEGLVAQLNQRYALPNNIGVVAAPCGEPNAFWSPTDQAIVICYELFTLMNELFRANASSDEELLKEILGATRFIFYHELGHALIDTFNIPFTGREEDAVDQFSTILLLASNQVEAALAGANFFYTFASLTDMSELVFWDEHSLDQQRFYDIVCLVYGSNPDTYAWLLQRDGKGFLLRTSQGYLPKERAERCYEEHKDISYSWDSLLSSYVSYRQDAPTQQTQAASIEEVLETSLYDETFQGELISGDEALEDGQFFDSYEVELVQGQEAIFELSSRDFDTYLMVFSPDDLGYLNDDAITEVDGYLSRLTIPISTTGTWVVAVSSYAAAEEGSYKLGVIKRNGIYNEVFSEQLLEGDSTYESGEYVDTYEYSFEPGQPVTVILSSLDFDPYLIVTTPSGESFVNDDFENQFGMSRLDFEAKESGIYTIAATSYEKGESGAYQLAISNLGAGQSPEETLFSDYQEGILAKTDFKYDSGEFYDAFNYEFSLGQNLIVDVLSDEFDTYVQAVSPSGKKYDNDNYYEDGSTDAGLDIYVEEAGNWVIYVSSSKVGEVGAYGLYITDIGNEAATDISADTAPAGDLFSDYQQGTLAKTDFKYQSGEFYDVFNYDFVPGQNLAIDAASSDFNTYLMAISPSGQQVYNDDYTSDNSNAGLDIYVEETGTWQIHVSSSQLGETGNYELYVKDIGTASTSEAEASTEASEVTAEQLSITDMNTSKARSTNLGVLEAGDDMLDDGSFVDYYSIDLEAGQEAVFTLMSADFNTYMGIMKPSGEIVEGDGVALDDNRSRFALQADETGTYYIFVTSETPGESGNYLMSIKK